MSKSIIGQNWIVFQVQACSDAHVALSELFNNVKTKTYEIIIGGNANKNSFIRDYDTFGEMQRVDTVDILDCNNYRTFWVKWGIEDRIVVGRGALLDIDSFLDWTDPEQRHFQGLTISTYYSHVGYWDFSFLEGLFIVLSSFTETIAL